MRRKDREITDRKRMTEILSSCDCCRVAMEDEGAPYIVPLNFGYDDDGENITLFFHCAGEGKKLELIRKSPYVGFEMDCGHALVKGENACSYSFGYQSIIGKGKAEILDDAAEKQKAMEAVMEHYSGENQWEFDEQVLKKVTFISLAVSEWSCKEHKII